MKFLFLAACAFRWKGIRFGSSLLACLTNSYGFFLNSLLDPVGFTWIYLAWCRERWNIGCKGGFPSLSCAKGGFIYQPHNELRDTIAKTIDEVRNDVNIEPRLEPISGESLNKGAIKSEGARSDVKAQWGLDERPKSIFWHKGIQCLCSAVLKSEPQKRFRHQWEGKKEAIQRENNKSWQRIFHPANFYNKWRHGERITKLCSCSSCLIRRKKGQAFRQNDQLDSDKTFFCRHSIVNTLYSIILI